MQIWRRRVALPALPQWLLQLHNIWLYKCVWNKLLSITGDIYVVPHRIEHHTCFHIFQVVNVMSMVPMAQLVRAVLASVFVSLMSLVCNAMSVRYNFSCLLYSTINSERGLLNNIQILHYTCIVHRSIEILYMYSTC